MLIPELISNGTLLLRPYCSEHDEKTVAWLNDPELRRTFGITYSITIENHRNWLSSQNELMIWAVMSNNKHIGNISIKVTDRHKKAYLEIYLAEQSERSRGLGTKVMTLVLNYAFSVLKLNRIFLYTRDDNTPANRLYQSLGFKKEGLERESIIDHLGEYRNQILWGLLEPDWMEQLNG